MRIGFIGSHSTGKTSVAKYITELDTRWTFVPSTARKVAAAGLGVNRQADHMSQILTTLSRFVDESRAFEISGWSMSDRTPLDSLAYTKYQIENVWTGDDLNDFYWDYSKKFVAETMKHYDVVFYFPVDAFAMTMDGLREDDEKYRLDIDGIIVELINDLGVKVLTVPNGTIEERSLYVLENIDAAIHI